MVSLSCIWSGSYEVNVKIQQKCIGKSVPTFTTVYILSSHIMNNNDSIRSCHHLLNELQPRPPDDSVSSCCQSSDWESSTSSLPLRPQEPAQSPSTVPETEHTHYDRWINFRWYQLIYNYHRHIIKLWFIWYTYANARKSEVEPNHVGRLILGLSVLVPSFKGIPKGGHQWPLTFTSSKGLWVPSCGRRAMPPSVQSAKSIFGSWNRPRTGNLRWASWETSSQGRGGLQAHVIAELHSLLRSADQVPAQSVAYRLTSCKICRACSKEIKKFNSKNLWRGRKKVQKPHLPHA